MKLSSGIIFCAVLLLILSVVTLPASAQSAELESLEVSEKINSYDFEMREEGGIYYLYGQGGTLVCQGDYEAVLSAVSEGAHLRFSGVGIEGGLVLNKSLTLSGELELKSGGITVDADTSFIGLSLYLAEGSVKIRDAALTVADSTLEAEGESSIIMDYSSSSAFRLLSGEIIQHSYSSALLLKRGSASLCGGVIRADYGFAVESYSTLRLCGNARLLGYSYGLKTDNPVWLSEGECSLDEDISVLYDGVFAQGSFTPVFYGASSDMTERITLFDKTGEECELSFFAESKYGHEGRMLAVYRPFEVKYYLSGELYFSEKYISGEEIHSPEAPTREGFVFFGWYKDELTNTPFSFGGSVASDISLYGRFALTPPEFQISSLSFVYDGSERTLSFESLYHPLMSEGSFSFNWYKNGVAVGSGSQGLAIKNVSDSGEYYCSLSFSCMGSFVTVLTPVITVTVERASLASPKIWEKEYNGTHRVADVPESTLYVSQNEGGTEVGSYQVVLTLTDPENYRWAESNTNELTLQFLIVKAKNSFKAPLFVKDCFVGDKPEISVSSLFGVPEIYFSSDPEGIWSEILPTVPGVYYSKAVVEESDSYYRLESEPVSFRLLNDSVCGIRIDTPPDKTLYYAFETIDPTGISVYATYLSGKSLPIPTEELSLVYQTGDCLLAGDSCVSVVFGDFSVPLAVTVRRASYDLSGIVFEDSCVIYDGARHTLSFSEAIVGKDGIPLEYRVVGGGVSVGRYEISLRFSVASPNYETPASRIAYLTVEPMPLEVEFKDLVFVYNGAQRTPAATVIPIEGMPLKLKVLGGATDAGEYTATAIFDNINYTLVNPEVNFRILKADLDLSGIFWSQDSFVYTGSPCSVSLSGLPDGVSVIGYTDSTFTEAGSYKTVASLYYDERNYNTPPEVYHIWQITPAEYDLSGLEILDNSAVYDGTAHYPLIVGEIPKGADGISLSISFSGGVVHVSEGIVAVRVSFSTESKNYHTPSSAYRFVSIKPKPVQVEWGSLGLVYTGEPMLPEARLSECGIILSGGGIDAGVYEVTARAESDDYQITNDCVSIVIEKAENMWITEPSVDTIFAGQTLSPVAQAIEGEAEFSYYLDPELTHPLGIPTLPGVYYAIAEVAEGKNHLSIKSDPIKFEIIAVVLVGIKLDRERVELVALSFPKKEDFSVIGVYNDGSETTVPHEEITLIFQNGELPRFGDGYMTVKALGQELVAELSVKKAHYDTSGVYWTQTQHVYDGWAKEAKLEGLPAGITLLGYELNGAVAAGVYDLKPILMYDSDNYEPPVIPEGRLVIERQSVDVPSVESFVYDGKSHSPVIKENSLYKAFITEGSRAGQYKITLCLTDAYNYSFSGSDTAEIFFTVQPREVTIKVIGENEYEITEGSIIEGDNLLLEFYSENGYIYLKSANPDYSITVIPLAESATDILWIWLIFFLVTLLFALATFAVFIKRDRLSSLLHQTAERVKGRKLSSEELPESLLLVTDEAHAAALISDTNAKSLIRKSVERIPTKGDKRAVVNIDAISESFGPGECVDINRMKERGLVPSDTGYVKVLAGGVIDKPLCIKANSFSLAAVKMIALTGGRATLVGTKKLK